MSRINREIYIYIPAFIVWIAGFVFAWLVLHIPIVAALFWTLPLGILSGSLTRRMTGKRVNWGVILVLILGIPGFFMVGNHIFQLGIHPDLNIICKELPTPYHPNIFSSQTNFYVISNKNDTFQEIGQPILFTVNNRGSGKAIRPHLKITVEAPFIISIFAIRSDGIWWSNSKGSSSKELDPYQYLVTFDKRTRREVKLTLAKILPKEVLEAYFLLLVPNPSQNLEAFVKVSAFTKRDSQEKEFSVIWEKERPKCKR